MARIRFGNHILDPDRGVVYCDGEARPLRRQSLEVLQELLRRSGQLATREELHRSVWGDKIVSDDSLAQCIAEIRKALGDTDRTLLKTMPRRGYLLAAKAIAVEDQPAAARFNSTRLLLASGLVAALVLLVLIIVRESDAPKDAPPALTPLSIAVMPFVDLSDEQNLQYVGHGVSEDILTSLTQIPELRVIARTSSFSLALSNPTISEIGSDLGVAYVMEGSVRRSESGLKVTAQLIKSDDSSHVWARTFDTGDFELSEIHREIADSALAVISPQSQEIRDRPLPNVTANELLLLGRHYQRQLENELVVDETLLAQVIDLYRQAVAADESSALAHSRLAGALIYAGDLKAAEAPVLKALSLDPKSSEVQQTLATYHWARALPGAGGMWKRAIELNPSNVEAISAYGYWYWVQGHSEGPEDYFKKALDLDPLHLARYAALGNFYAHEARTDDAQVIINQIRERFDSAAAAQLLARLYELIGDIPSSIEWLNRAALLGSNIATPAAKAELMMDVGIPVELSADDLDPGIGLLIKSAKYDQAIERGELDLFEFPEDLSLRYLLAFAYNVKGRFGDSLRVLEPTDLPDTVFPETRTATDVEGFIAYLEALHGSGDEQLAIELAERWIRRPHTANLTWWTQYTVACPMALAGQHIEARRKLELIPDSPRLPWIHLFKDSYCFAPYQSEAWFQEMLGEIEVRFAGIRKQLQGLEQ